MPGLMIRTFPKSESEEPLRFRRWRTTYILYRRVKWR